MKLRFFFILSAVACIAGSCGTPKTLTMPAFLNEGDKVALITPASRIDRNSVDSMAAALSGWGLVPVYAEHVADSCGSFGGSDAERTEDLLRALRDPEIKAIMCTRGGYGAAHILCNLPLDSLRRYPKWITGYSDITALHSAQICAGNMSIHANMATPFKHGEGTDTVSLMLKDLLYGQLPTYHSVPHEYDSYGEAEGILIGGNMSVYGGLAGSEYDFFNAIDAKEIILFIEDVGESCRSVNRMLHLLMLRGITDKVKGIVVGRFVDCPGGNSFESINEMLHFYLKELKIPVAYDFPIGHDESYNYPVIEGCKVKFTVGPDGSTLKFLEK
ncbi:MAG: LD-carboxypeptidase [Bacteroidales bacterium]|nr:LD-carboxypeptidase [Bacteroidales bacterium]